MEEELAFLLMLHALILFFLCIMMGFAIMHFVEKDYKPAIATSGIFAACTIGEVFFLANSIPLL